MRASLTCYFDSSSVKAQSLSLPTPVDKSPMCEREHRRTPMIGPKPLNNDDSRKDSDAEDELRTLLDVRSETPDEVDGLEAIRVLVRL